MKTIEPGPNLTNAEIAANLFALAQLLAAQKENPFRVKAYRRAAKSIRNMGESMTALVRDRADLTAISGIGPAIAGVIQEIVETGSTRQIQALASKVAPEVATIANYPGLDPRRVLRIYKKLKISTIEELKERLDIGEIGRTFGPRLEQHVRRGLADHQEVLLYEADRVAAVIRDFLVKRCGATRVELVGDCRRRVEVIDEIHFLIETADFKIAIHALRDYGGNAELVQGGQEQALFKLPSGLLLRVTVAQPNRWGLALLEATGSKRHLELLNLQSLRQSKDIVPNEGVAYAKLGLQMISPELREGRDEIELSATGRLPQLLTVDDIRGELHAHSTSSDGVDSLEDMAEAARQRGLEYIGINDHSQSLKIARGLSIERLRNQLRFIDRLNGRLRGVRILKSAEVDILQDGSLDYPDDLLAELDYTVCSIHSRFGLGKEQQTTRILHAMDNRNFTILGHATGRLLLKRPGYEIDIDKVIEHAGQTRCFLELNSSPDRLDLSADHARLAKDAGILIAITTDAHSTRELGYLQYGVEQARRAGLEKRSTLNCLAWPEFKRAIVR